MVLSLAAFYSRGPVYIYSNPVWTKLDRAAGNQTAFQGPADKGFYKACKLFPLK